MDSIVEKWKAWMENPQTREFLKEKLWDRRMVIHRQWASVKDEIEFRKIQIEAHLIDNHFEFLKSKSNMTLRQICTAANLELE